MAVPDRGSATVETALALPSMVLLAMALVGIITGVATQIRCVDAARLAARATARGEADGSGPGRRAARPAAGEADRQNRAGLVHASVTAPLSGLPLLRSFTVSAEADAAVEGSDSGDDADRGHADQN